MRRIIIDQLDGAIRSRRPQPERRRDTMAAPSPVVTLHCRRPLSPETAAALAALADCAAAHLDLPPAHVQDAALTRALAACDLD